MSDWNSHARYDREMEERLAILTTERDDLAAQLANIRRDYEACYEDVRRLGDALGLFSGARPVSAHVVMSEYIAQVARWRPVVEAATALRETFGIINPRLEALYRAVDALRAEEGEAMR